MSSRKILVLGATGGTGREVVSQGLQQGHQVTAFVRRPERMTTRSERLRVIVGDVTSDGGALDDAVRSQEVVISALGIGKSFRPRGFIARSVPRILEAMRRQRSWTAGLHLRIRRGGYLERHADPAPDLHPHAVALVYADKAAGEELLRRSELDWTLVYPTGLTHGPRTGRYRVGERLKLTGFPTISRADLADFLLRQVEDRTFVRKGVLISY